jgi:hypothetical protein
MSNFETTTKHQPAIKLTQIERDEKCSQHEFGICDTCDAGLDNRDDFVVTLVADGIKVRCNACEIYYQVEESVETIFCSCYDEFSF